MKYKFLSISLLTLMVNCLSLERRKIIDVYPKQRRKSNQIEIKYSDISEPHVILGVLTLRYNKGYKNQYILSRFQAEAAKLGADGIIFKKLKRYSSGWQMDGNRNPRASDINSSQYRRDGFMYRYLEE